MMIYNVFGDNCEMIILESFIGAANTLVPLIMPYIVAGIAGILIKKLIGCVVENCALHLGLCNGEAREISNHFKNGYELVSDVKDVHDFMKK